MISQASVLDAQSIVDDITSHIRKQAGPVSNWYVGITADIEQRVFGAHRVPREKYWRIHRRAISSSEARAAEKALLNWGCDGGDGGGNETAVFVYAYLKTSRTNP